MMLFCSCFQVEKNTAACDLIARTVPKTLGSPQNLADLAGGVWGCAAIVGVRIIRCY